ncbi:MAG TPA: 4Fe-4S dicluster domain-containing protein [Chloroflexi bacterium]|nr:MAG: 4Fe-4S ferredoxin [Deltaproteobacteria bacterium]HDD24840.1 4Fe-4S dicluster domain-containing protein [Chloroflexota bacterium]
MDSTQEVETAEILAESRSKVTGRQRKSPRLPRGRVTIFPNWCKGCDLCIEFCPTNVLARGPDDRVVVAHPEACTACRWCELHCPDFAIFVTEIEPEEEVD